MTTFTGRFTVGSNLTLTSPVDLGTAKYSVNMDTVHSFTDGEGLNQAEQVFTDQRTLAASANEELDLSGSLTDAFGTTLVFTSIKAMIITCAAANTNDLLVGGAAANAWSTWASDDTDEVIVVPGKYRPHFKPGKELRERVNNKRR